MSENKPGLLDELKKWLEFEEEPKEESSSSKLREQLAMEKDPEKRELLKKKIDAIEESSELADDPANLLGGY